MMTRFRHYENLHYQYETGTVGESQFQGFRRLMAYHLRYPGTRAWWTRARLAYSDEFVAYIATLLEGLPEGKEADQHGPGLDPV